jgi:RNA polymerase sigma-70 factor (ECF subfamily)
MAVAEELTQELFLVVWRDARRFRGRASVRTWMYRIAYNQAVSWLRKKKPVLWEEAPEIESSEPWPETQALLAEQREKIVASLAELSPDHRTVIELTFYHQMSYQEISQVMDCPVGTVKSRMSYARRYLAAALKRNGVEER